MARFDPRRDPPYFAVIGRTAPPGIDAGQYMDAGERSIGRAAAEPGFLGIEEVIDPHDQAFTVCYWRKPESLRRWREELPDHLPPKISADSLVHFEGCFWHWLDNVFEAVARVERDNIVQIPLGERAA
tara:strand:- start:47407 stop:47790 length:384 start_codon:yes stop_codon:yes gene_type:complete